MASTNDLLGIFYLLGQGESMDESYFSAIQSMRTLFAMPEFSRLVIGYYLSNKDGFLRLSYFAHPENGKAAHKIIEEFVKSSGIIEPRDSEISRINSKLASNLEFREFLDTYTQISLDLIKDELEYARKLMLWIRFVLQPNLLLSGNQPEMLTKLNDSLMKRSSTYSKMSSTNRTKFLDHLTKPDKNDWAHMMVNFLIGPDPRWQSWSNEKINRWLSDNKIPISFPDDWQP
jgi:hypothetical protein